MFTPTYSTSTNRITSAPFTGACPGRSRRDANGNTTHDNAHTYSWDAEGRPVTQDAIGATYDALGRVVEQNGTTEIVYGLGGGKLALMNGQTLAKAFVPLPAGAVAVYASGGLSYFRHPDWLGSSRISSDPSHNIVSDLAYAPYGETYAESGTPDRSFTGQNQDTISNSTTGLYDFPFRQYAQYGRWISPDPAGLGAASLAAPQSLNRYAYVANNPLLLVDPLGLRYCLPDPCSGIYSMAGGGSGFLSVDDMTSGGPGTCPPTYPACDDSGGLYFYFPIGFPVGWGGSGPGQPPAPNPPTTGGQPPLSGETLGIPNGMRIPVPNPWSVILPTDPTCDFGPCFEIGAGFTKNQRARFKSWLQKLMSYPWVGSVLIPVIDFKLASIGVAGSVTYVPATGTICGAVGAGVAFPAGGRSASLGPLISGDTQNQQQVIRGWSVSANVQPPGVGWQTVWNNSGILSGPTVGLPGASVTYTTAGCLGGK